MGEYRCVCGKQIFGSEEEAQKTVARLQERSEKHSTLRAYICNRGQCWHIGHVSEEESRIAERDNRAAKRASVENRRITAIRYERIEQRRRAALKARKRRQRRTQ